MSRCRPLQPESRLWFVHIGQENNQPCAGQQPEKTTFPISLTESMNAQEEHERAHNSYKQSAGSTHGLLMDSCCCLYHILIHELQLRK